MDYMLVCTEEIALEGLDGCPIVKLWKNLEERIPPFPLHLDDDVKNYLWKGIVEALDVKFYLLENPLPHIFSENEEDEMDETKTLGWNLQGINIDLSFNSLHMVSDGETRGNCPEYETRKDITTEVKGTAGQCLVSLDEAMERWGNHIVIVASQERRDSVLISEVIDPNIILTTLQYCVLEHIGQSRSRGRLQMFMTNHFPTDPTLFYLLKTFKQTGFIKKQKIVIYKGPAKVLTNIVRIKRFCALAYHHCDIMGSDMCQLLQQQPDHMMSFMDLTKHFEHGRVAGSTRPTSVKRVRQYLETLGHVKTVIIQGPSVRGAGQGMKKYCIKLVTPLVLRTSPECVDDDEQDDDDDDDIDEWPCNPNLIMEQPLIKQLYDFIESKGPAGLTNKELDKEIRLMRFDRRAAMSHLEKKGHIKHLFTYAGRQSNKRYIAMPYLEANFYAKKILEEQKKLEAIKEEVALPAADDPSTANSTPLDSPCPSPAPSIQSQSSTKVSGRKKQVTYRKLKRDNFIVDLLKQRKVIEGSMQILKAVQETEGLEGLETKMDRKYLKKCLNTLIENGMIKKLKTIIDVNNVSTNVEYYLHSSINPQDQEVKNAIDVSRFRLSGDQAKAEANAKRQAKKTSSDEDDDSGNEKVMWNHDLRYSYGYLAKFPRMQLLHEFMWHAIFGVKKKKPETKTEYEIEHAGTVETGTTGTDEPTNEPPEIKVESRNIDSTMFVQRNKEMSTGELNTENHDYNWIGNLEPLPEYDVELGWVKLNDLLQIMPLSIYCSTIGIIKKVEGLDEYYLDPNKIHTPFKDLPRKLRKRLKFKGRYIGAYSGIISYLMCAGMLMPKRPIPLERLETIVHFSRGAIVLDTSQEFTVGDSKLQESHNFPFRQFVFKDYSDVQLYWEELKYICLRTPYARLRTDKSKTMRSFKFSDCVTGLILEDNIVPPPGDAMGAAGLDSFMYGHIAKNWSFRKGDFMKFRIFSSEKRKSKPSGDDKPAKKKLKTTTEDLISRVKKKRVSTVFPVEAEDIPTKRLRTDEDATTLENNGNQEPETVNISGHMVAVDDTDKAAIAMKTKQRTVYSPENDRILILCRIALGVMNNITYRSPYPFKQIRDILHEYCPDALDKTAPNCKARLFTLMKNAKNVLTVKVCVEEYTKEEEFAGVDNPKLPFTPTFLSTVKRIIQLSRTQASSLEYTSKLLSSLDELHENYKVQQVAMSTEPVGFEDPCELGPPIQTIDDIRHSVAKDIIQITCQTRDIAPSSCINRMFDDFDLDEIIKAGRDLRKSGMICRKRDHSATSRNMPWKLTTEYLKLLDPSPKQSIPVTVFKEAGEFTDSCYGLTGHKGRKVFRLTEESICGGEVAAVLSLLITGMVTAEHHIPDEVLAHILDANKNQSKAKSAMKAKPKKTKPAPMDIVEQGTGTCEGDLSNDKHPFIKPSSTKELEAVELGTETSEGGLSNDKRPFIRPSLSKEGNSPPRGSSSQPDSLGSSQVKNTVIELQGPTSKATPGNLEQDLTNKETPSDLEQDLTNKERESGLEQDLTSKENTSDVEKDCVSKNDMNIVSTEYVNSSNGNLDKKTNSQTVTDNDISSESSTFKVPADVKGQKGASARKPGTSNTEKLNKPRKMKRKVTGIPKNLKNPFINNQALTHCKFNTNVIHQNTASGLFTPKYVSTPPTKPVTHGNIDLVRPIRSGRMLSKDLKQPKLLTTQGYNTLDSIKINDCNIFIRPRVANSNKSDVSKATNNKSNTCKVTNGNQSHITPGDRPRAVAIDTDYENRRIEMYPFCVDVAEEVKDVPTLDEYLECSNSEDFNEMDKHLVRIIYEAASKEQHLGVTVAQLKQILQEMQLVLDQTFCTLEEHVKKLCNSKVLFQVGTFQKHFITPHFAKPWSINVKKIYGEPVEELDNTCTNTVSTHGQTSGVVSTSTGSQEITSRTDELSPAIVTTVSSTTILDATLSNVTTKLSSCVGSNALSEGAAYASQILTVDSANQQVVVPMVTQDTLVGDSTTANSVTSVTIEDRMTRVTTEDCVTSVTPEDCVTSMATEDCVTTGDSVTTGDCVTTKDCVTTGQPSTTNIEPAVTEMLDKKGASTLSCSQGYLPMERNLTVDNGKSQDDVTLTVMQPTSHTISTEVLDRPNPSIDCVASQDGVTMTDIQPTSHTISTEVLDRPNQSIDCVASQDSVTMTDIQPTSHTISTEVLDRPNQSIDCVASQDSVAMTDIQPTSHTISTEVLDRPNQSIDCVAIHDGVAMTDIQPTSHTISTEVLDRPNQSIDCVASQDSVAMTDIQPTSHTTLTQSTVDGATSSTAMQTTASNVENTTGPSKSSVSRPPRLYSVLSRPWLQPDGEVHKDMFKSLLNVLVTEMVSNPGITEFSLNTKFTNAVRPVPLSHVLEYLVDIGCITRHELTVAKPSLFSSDMKKVIYYMPVVDCIVTLGKATQSMT